VISAINALGNPLPAVVALLQHKLGRLPFAELGEKLRLRQSRDLSISYMGLALRRVDPRVTWHSSARAHRAARSLRPRATARTQAHR
jgi:hypothetical protein